MALAGLKMAERSVVLPITDNWNASRANTFVCNPGHLVI